MKQLISNKLLKTSFLLMLMLLVPMVASAKKKAHVSYSTVIISVDKNAGAYSLIVTIMDRRFTENPVMMLRTFGGDVIKLSGKDVENVTLLEGLTEKGSARFPISQKQLSQIRTGIKKVRLSTTPYVHEKEFKKDKIGKKIYDLYQNMQDSEF